MRIWKRNSSADAMVNKEEERGCAVGIGINILLHCVTKIMVRQAAPLQSMECPTVLQSIEPMKQKAPGGSCGP